MTASCSSLCCWAHDRTQGWRSPAGSSFGERNTPLLGKMGLPRDPLNLPPNYKSHTIKFFKCFCYPPQF
ncbi:hypothetical protein [Microcoleus sp. B3-A4]|uniref:hypothetical protein n=1 Tax=Microcoleus sp. B3-A4 TaxID=2818653 RepID=UPI002FD6B869